MRASQAYVSDVLHNGRLDDYLGLGAQAGDEQSCRAELSRYLCGGALAEVPRLVVGGGQPCRLGSQAQMPGLKAAPVPHRTVYVLGLRHGLGTYSEA